MKVCLLVLCWTQFGLFFALYLTLISLDKKMFLQLVQLSFGGSETDRTSLRILIRLFHTQYFDSIIPRVRKYLLSREISLPQRQRELQNTCILRSSQIYTQSRTCIKNYQRETFFLVQIESIRSKVLLWGRNCHTISSAFFIFLYWFHLNKHILYRHVSKLGEVRQGFCLVYISKLLSSKQSKQKSLSLGKALEALPFLDVHLIVCNIGTWRRSCAACGSRRSMVMYILIFLEQIAPLSISECWDTRKFAWIIAWRW